MKKSLLLSGVLALTISAAQATVFSFSSGTLNASVPDGNPAGYSSSIVASGIVDDLADDTILDVNVTLNISGGYNGDLYGYLVSPDGVLTVLLNRTGRTSGNSFGYADAGFNVTLDDSAATDIHAYGGNGGSQLTGTYQPDGRTVNPSTVLDTDTRDTLLAAMNNGNGNGTWTLFLADFSGGENSTLVSWGFTVDVVPEPTTWALIIFGVVAAGFALRRVIARKAA
jgi:subtilisin-like proprotein convertase family protein